MDDKSKNERTRRLIQTSGLSPLNIEQESAAFMAYCVFAGDLSKVSLHTKTPLDILMITAERYEWPLKRERIFGDATTPTVVNSVEKDMVNTLLLATWESIKADPTRLLPKNVHGLQLLLTMVETLNGAPQSAAPAPQPSITVHATNAQIVSGPQQPAPTDRLSLLRLANKASAE